MCEQKNEKYLKSLFKNSEMNYQDLIQFVDESTFSLSDWMNAYERLQVWLRQRSLKLSVKNSFDYIHCASKANSNQVHLQSLDDLTSEFLNTYGCERAENIQ